MFNVEEALQFVNTAPWKEQDSLPQTTDIQVIAIDFETRDPELTTKGPGFVYGKAHAIGVAIAANTGDFGYYPFAHTQDNTQKPIRLWLRTLLSNPDLVVVMANARYDMEVLWSLGIVVKSHVVDVQVLEALLDENQSSYKLDSIAKRRGFQGKSKEYMESKMPRNAKGEPDYTRLAEVAPSIVGPYAEVDALLTLAVYQQQIIEIEKEDLVRVAKLESDLIPLLMKMRTEGIRVDVARAERENQRLTEQNDEILKQIHRLHPGLSTSSTDSLATMLKTYNIEIPLTEKKNESVTNEFLKTLDIPVAKMLVQYRQTEKIRKDFIQGMVIEQSYKGRLHPQWFQTRGSSFMSGDDTGGTRSGRLSSMNPALTTIPARHPELGPLTRSMFLPEEGDLWFKGDYSQQEPRIALSYAVKMKLTGAQEMLQKYIDDPKIDYHQMITDRVNEVRSQPIIRRIGKDINLGLAYGMGKKKMAGKLGLSMAQSQSIIGDYHIAVPWMAKLQQIAMNIAEQRKYVKTNMGRRRRFDEWEPIYWKMGSFPVVGYDAAVAKYGKVRRSGLHKALNSIIQGSAAEQMKSTMVAAYEAGYNIKMTLYDELGISIPDNEDSKQNALRLKDLMENTMRFEVPHNVDPQIGPSWGELNEL